MHKEKTYRLACGLYFLFGKKKMHINYNVNLFKEIQLYTIIYTVYIYIYIYIYIY